MADGLFGVLRHQRFQLGFGALMLQKGLSGAAEYTGKLPPGVRGAHIHDPDGFDSWLWWFDAKEARGLAAFDTTPEFSFGRNDEMLIERIGMGGDLDPFAAASDHREHRGPGRHRLCDKR